MFGLYRKILRVTNNSIEKGIIKTFYQKYPNLYELEWETLPNDGSTDKSCIINDNSYCITPNRPNSSFTFHFPNTLLNITGFSLLSCLYNKCVNSFDIFAFDLETKNWNLISEVRKEPLFFHNTTKYVECKTKTFTNAIKLVQTAKNTGIIVQDNDQFAIRFFDFFGDLLMDPSVITFFCQSKIQFHSYHFIFFLLFK